MHFPLIRRVALVAALTVPAVLPAQASQESSPPLGAPLVTMANAERLRPGKWVYVTRLMGGGPPRRLGFRTLELSSSSYGDRPAWLLVDSRQLATVTLAESLYVSKADLTPLYRVAHAPGSLVVTKYGRDSIRTTFEDDSGRGTVAMASEPGVLANLYLIELLVGVSPLDTGWHGSARLAAVGRDGSGVVPIETRAVGEETIAVPDGSFDCWILSVKVGPSHQKLWVRKSDGVVIKERLPVLGMAGTEVELLLALGGTAR